MYQLRTAFMALLVILVIGCEQALNEPFREIPTIEIQVESSIKSVGDCYDELINRVGQYRGTTCNICGSSVAAPGETIKVYSAFYSNGRVTSKEDMNFEVSWSTESEAIITPGEDPREILLTLPDNFDYIHVDVLSDFNGFLGQARLYIRNLNQEIQVRFPGQAGLVIYDKGSYANDWRYMEISEKFIWSQYTDPTPGTFETGLDQSWGFEGELIGASGTGIGEGRTNTINLLTQMLDESNSDIEVDETYKPFSTYTVYNESINGYSDWHLPSIEEAQEYITAFNRSGDFSGNGSLIWTSTEIDAENAYAMNVFSGEAVIKNKSEKLRVYGVRYF
ncbi:MAG: hypothetical protein R8G66_09570 [Cytophagales bacterium]|nr:hypothetical protein [Cytophagales bacterium]